MARKRKKNIPSAFLLLLVFAAFALFLASQYINFNSLNLISQNNLFTAQIAGNTAKVLNSLQMQTINFTTPTPTPTTHPPTVPTLVNNPPTCGVSSQWTQLSKDSTGNCCVLVGPSNDGCCPGMGVIDPDPGIRNAITTPYAVFCGDKPVIYLYPREKTSVDVKVTVPGKITTSFPKYPEDGWKNVTAYPDGKLFYEGKFYNELFYESELIRTLPPFEGVVVKKDDLAKELTYITSALGLNHDEQEEFLKYWVPRLSNLKKPYVLISYFSPEVKNYLDKVEISPKPNVFIEFMMYFKGLDNKADLPPMELPASPPERWGFTAVEWGGILDH